MVQEPARRRKSGGVVPSPNGTRAEHRHIVASKLSAPPLRKGIVDRQMLLDRLGSAAYTPVLLISAPAGYGKTTLLALWRDLDSRPFAWVTLDASDNDPVAFAACLVAALAG